VTLYPYSIIANTSLQRGVLKIVYGERSPVYF